MKKGHLFLWVVLLFLSYDIVAQDATESPTSTVGGSFQGETGVFYESFKNRNTKNEIYSLGATLLLYGIREHIEIRMGWDFQEQLIKVNNIRQGDVLSGFSPLQLGGTIDMLSEKGILPQISLLGDVFLPFTASTDFEPERVTGEVRVIFYHTLTSNSNLSYNLGWQWGEGTAFLYTLAYSQNFTSKWGFYAELAGDFAEGESADHFWDIGITYLIDPKLQFDTVTGTAIQGEQDFYWGGRLTLMLPKPKKRE